MRDATAVDGPPVGRAAEAVPPALGPTAQLEMTARRLGPVRRFFRRRPVAMDVVVVLVFFTGIAPVTGPERPGGMTAGVAMLLACGAFAIRRSRPVLTAASIGVLSVVTVTATGALSGFDLGIAFAVYAVTVARPPRVAWTTLALLLGTAITSVWLVGAAEVEVGTVLTADGETFTPDERAAGTTSVIILGLAAIAIGSSVRTRRQHLADLIARAEDLARDRDQQVRLARAAERSRIAREMHDVIAHSVSVMIALADGANAAFERSPERARTALTELSGTGRAALDDLRRVLGVLGDDDDPPGPGDDAVAPGPTDDDDLTELVERFRTAGLRIRATGLGTPLPDDRALRLGVRRILTESLTNALRHAPGASSIEVTLVRAHGPDRIVLEVADSGATLPVTEAGGAGQGLVGMAERAALQGGEVSAGPHGAGWRVHAELPWTDERDR